MKKLYLIALVASLPIVSAGVMQRSKYPKEVQEFIRAQRSFAMAAEAFGKKYFTYCPAPVTPIPKNMYYNNLVSEKIYTASYSNPSYGGIGGARTCYVFDNKYLWNSSMQNTLNVPSLEVPVRKSLPQGWADQLRANKSVTASGVDNNPLEL